MTCILLTTANYSGLPQFAWLLALLVAVDKLLTVVAVYQADER